MGDATDLCFTPAIELLRLLRAGEPSAVELVEAVLERIDAKRFLEIDVIL
jgi:Asp-tRNA(Asn)/Glu-tRNA(Gln) amidotransferase A subunit family amidase